MDIRTRNLTCVVGTREVLEALIEREHPNFHKAFLYILCQKVLDFKGIFGAIRREGVCYDLRSRVDAKACFSTIVRCTCLTPSISFGSPPFRIGWMGSRRQ